MGEMPRLMRPSELRAAVTEWAEKGFTVKVGADGSITVTPPTASKGDDFDLVDFRK